MGANFIGFEAFALLLCFGW